MNVLDLFNEEWKALRMGQPYLAMKYREYALSTYKGGGNV